MRRQGFRLHLAFVCLIFATAVAWTAKAEAGMKFCSQYDEKLFVIVLGHNEAFPAMDIPEHWTMYGWVNVSPGECFEILPYFGAPGGMIFYFSVHELTESGNDTSPVPVDPNEPYAIEEYFCVYHPDAFEWYYSTLDEYRQCPQEDGYGLEKFQMGVQVPAGALDYDLYLSKDSLSAVANMEGPPITESPDYLEWDDRINPWDWWD